MARSTSRLIYLSSLLNPGPRLTILPRVCLERNKVVKVNLRTNYFLRPTSTSSTAYPSGSAKNPTKVLPASTTSLSQSSPQAHSSHSKRIPLAHRKLPELPNRRPLYILTFVAISGVWATFVYFSTNAEKANSTVVNAVLFELRTNPVSQEALGSPIRAEKDDMFGQLWVDGQINLMQGAVDVAFRVKGSSNSGKVYFTSVRRERDAAFEIIRWKLIRDDGAIFDLSQQPVPQFFTGDGTSTLIKPLKARETGQSESGGYQGAVLSSAPDSTPSERLL
ncbi:hypothetical protein CROQUDRAFT_655569 [Cronartium quercuum f. sp. fusiforme G11]|uniref:Uncharacterized protein n=1 Tax=Cronartium quercuum f. sp. fusiforme G11 TaxID=708437 RepID=A0A9P6NLX1_9BASI|nr:hypothetical protein CROQUDRAFT_655569 [Cronartium quercuum f. sp. fusiforme G11]